MKWLNEWSCIVMSLCFCNWLFSFNWVPSTSTTPSCCLFSPHLGFISLITLVAARVHALGAPLDMYVMVGSTSLLLDASCTAHLSEGQQCCWPIQYVQAHLNQPTLSVVTAAQWKSRWFIRFGHCANNERLAKVPHPVNQSTLGRSCIWGGPLQSGWFIIYGHRQN